MKKLIALLLIVSLVFVVVEKRRIFVRDPIATVTRNNAKVDGEQVFINYNNDILLENDNPPMLVMAVQKDQPVGVPTKLRCVHWAACLTDADVATTLPVGPPAQSMTNKVVHFRDKDNHEWVVSLR